MGKKLLPPCQGWVARPFPSFPKPLYQSKAKCKQSKWYENDFSFWWRWNLLSHKGFALSLVLKVTVFGTWKCPIEQWAHELHCGKSCRTEQSWLSKGGLGEILFIFKNYYKTLQCFITIHYSSDYHNLRQLVITIYDSLVITIYDRYYNLWLLLWQFTTIVISIYDSYYNFRQGRAPERLNFQSFLEMFCIMLLARPSKRL